MYMLCMHLNYSNIRCASVTGNRVGTSVFSNAHMIISIQYYTNNRQVQDDSVFKQNESI